MVLGIEQTWMSLNYIVFLPPSHCRRSEHNRYGGTQPAAQVNMFGWERNQIIIHHHDS